MFKKKIAKVEEVRLEVRKQEWLEVGSAGSRKAGSREALSRRVLNYYTTTAKRVLAVRE